MIEIIKIILCIIIVVNIIIIPSFLASVNKKGNYDVFLIRIGSLLLGWTIIGYLLALWWAVKK